MRSRFLRVWAAVSTPVLVLGLGGLLIRPTVPVLVGFLTFLVVFGVVEAIGLAAGAGVRDRAGRVGAVDPRCGRADPRAAVELAPGAGGAAAVVALVLLVVNVRELRSD